MENQDKIREKWMKNRIKRRKYYEINEKWAAAREIWGIFLFLIFIGVKILNILQFWLKNRDS